MSLWSEFKEFALKGNAVDLAVGVVIGAAFGSIVKSLVEDVIMPPFGLITGGVDFSDKHIRLKEAVMDAAGNVTRKAVDLRYGVFLNNIINFAIVAVAIFAVIKIINMAKKKPQPAPTIPPAPSAQELLLAEIRDAIKAQGHV